MNPFKTTKSGSALLLTLLVVSLLLGIVLSFTVYVRLQLREVSNRIELFQARHNAKLGMQLALAQLQKAAGPDQRVTATAALIGDTVMPWRTGVWDTQNPNTAPTWLISNASTATTPSQILMVGDGTLGSSPNPQDVVEAPRISFGSDNESGYAYWVSDEGVKASLGIGDPFINGLKIGSLTREESLRMRYAVPVRSAQEYSFDPPVDFEDPLINSFVEFSFNLNQFPLLTGLKNPKTEGGYHDYTHTSIGLLTQTVNGGIKKDLSRAPDLLGPGFEAYMNFQDYIQEPDASNFLVKTDEDLRRLHHITPPSNLNPVDGEIVHSVVPIITDFGMQFSPHPRSSSDRTALISMQFILELWNPYTTGLVAEDLMLEITGLQPITMELGSGWKQTFDTEGTFGNTLSIRLPRDQYHTGTHFLSPDSYDRNVHGSGRLLYWTGPDTSDNKTPDAETGSFANRFANRTRLVLPAVPSVAFPPDNSESVRYEIPSTDLTITLRKAPENGGDILAVYKNFQYDEVDSGIVGTLGSWQYRWLTYCFRIIERGTTYLGDRSAWLKYVDKRTPSPSLGDDISQDIHTVYEEASSYSPDDSALKNTLSVSQDRVKYYFDRVLSTSAWSQDTRRDIPLFELPRQPLLSIGQLQHLNIQGMPPYSIGNPWGGSTWNRLFDEFFLSGMQDGISMPDLSMNSRPVPHPRLEWADPENLGMTEFTNSTVPDLGEDSALALQVKGQFNLNSASTKAWKSVIAGSIFHEFYYVIRDTNLHDDLNDYTEKKSFTDFGTGFTRFPQSLQELFDVDVEALDSRDEDRPDLNLKPGITFLSERIDTVGEDTDYNTSDTSLIDTFVDNLVTGIKKRVSDKGRPYFSLEEFINEDFKNGDPILETMIEESGLRRIHTPSGILTTPEERTPSWLSQADILSALAPFLSARSDTFIIRAYGDAGNINGSPQARAWCEAVVQRTITPVDSISSLTDMTAAPTGLGRKFKIISFKWLSESEI